MLIHVSSALARGRLDCPCISLPKTLVASKRHAEFLVAETLFLAFLSPVLLGSYARGTARRCFGEETNSKRS